MNSSVKPRRTVRLVQLASMGLIAVSAAAMLTVQQDTPAQATETGSAVTLNWAGDNADSLQQYQPERDPKSIHYDDFDRLSVSVSQTRDLTDQVVQVRVAGFDGPTTKDSAPNQGEIDATNFVQAMQCWGDPAAEDFYKNCIYGGWNAGSSPSSGREVFAGGGESYVDARGSTRVDVPFRTAQRAELSSFPIGNKSPLQEWFSWANTNERVKELVNHNGTSNFEFELQSANAAPHLGCGKESERCWLVIIPRGSHISAQATTDFRANEGCPIRPHFIGTHFQVGSPINPACDYWANRVVVPLDFRPVTQACAVGSAERRAVGSELLGSAFGSWQPSLCETTGTAYSFAQTADLAARSQLLAGQVGMAFINQPLTEKTVANESEAAQLAETEIAYAPLSISALTIVYQANNEGSVPQSVRLTPRLVAKLLTHSYAGQNILSTYAWEFPAGSWSIKPDQSNRSIIYDPEFTQLNGTDFARPGGSFVLTGPNGADAIELLWRYVQADDDARDFLGGHADPWGMVVNPYYLPAGHSNARVPQTEPFDMKTSSGLIGKTDAGGNYLYREVGLPIDLTKDAPNTFPKAEQTLGPQILSKTISQSRHYDITQAEPYAADYSSVARLVFNGDTNSKILWDQSKLNGAGELGDYVSIGRFFRTSVFMTGVADSATADKFALATAELQLPNKSGSFARADPSGMLAALAAQADTGVEGVGFTDPAQLREGAYPLTLVTYAAVNLTSSDEAARSQYANLIDYAAGPGQVQGSGRGQLPHGYLPLTPGLSEQARAASAAIRAWQPGSKSAPAAAPPAQSNAPTAADRGTATSTTPSAQTSVSGVAAAKRGETGSLISPGSLAIGGSLLAGLAGVLGAPFLLRRSPL